MFTVCGARARYCDGVSRRNFLQIGAAGLAGLTLTDLLRADEAGLSNGNYQKKSIINVYLGGGPSHIDTFDMKPEAPKEFRGEFNPIDTNVPGIQICEHLPKLASMMDKLAIVRSLTGIHEEHTPHQTETGWSEQSLRSSGGRPSLGSVVARLHGANNGAAPTFVDLTGHTRHGFLGVWVHGGVFCLDGEGRGQPDAERRHDRPAGRLSTVAHRPRSPELRIRRLGFDEALRIRPAQRAVSVITSGEVAWALGSGTRRDSTAPRAVSRAQQVAPP